MGDAKISSLDEKGHGGGEGNAIPVEDINQHFVHISSCFRKWPKSVFWNKLEQLYVHYNKISTLLPLKSLTQLKEIYVNFNELTSFEGITKHHEKHLKIFFCLPNDKISFKDVMQFERKMGIKCVGLNG